MSNMTFQEYKSPSGDKYVFQVSDKGVIYVHNITTGNTKEYVGDTKVQIEEALKDIVDWISNPLAFESTLEVYMEELKKAQAKFTHPTKPVTKRKP